MKAKVAKQKRSNIALKALNREGTKQGRIAKFQEIDPTFLVVLLFHMCNILPLCIAIFYIFLYMYISSCLFHYTHVHVPSTQNIAGWNPARGSSFFLLEKKKRVVFGRSCLLCLVSLK